MTLRQVLGQKAKELRKARQKTQQQIAEELNALDRGFTFHREDISAFERTGEKMGLEKIEALFDFLGYTLVPSEKKTSLIYQ